jgi:hypothetical protein
MPLSMLVGNEAVVAEIVKRQEELHHQSEIEKQESSEGYVQMTPEELEDFMNEGNSEFLDNPEDFKKHMIWNDPINKSAVKELIKTLEEVEEENKKEFTSRCDISNIKRNKNKVVIE